MPEWFAAFLADRGTRKPSVHTMKAYRQDFDAIATLVVGAVSQHGCTLIGARSVYSKKCPWARSAGCSHHTPTTY